MRCVAALVMAVPGLIVSTADIAAADPLRCNGRVVTIDLDDPAAPDPNRDAPDVVDGTAGDDRIVTGGGADWVCADDGDDRVEGGAGRDLIYGDEFGTGGDPADDGADTLFGGDGNDTLVGYDGADVARGGAGDDGIYLRGEDPASVREEAYGGAGDDVLTGSPDDELFVGGGGNDTVSYLFPCRDCGTEYPDPPVGVTIDLRLTGPQDTGGRGIDQFSSIENLIGTGDEDVLRGNGERNRLDGFYGDDILNGRRGADYLRGGPGTDRCIGGPGRDRYEDCE